MKNNYRLTAEELRKAILQLAIQGKLVKQDPNDEPASVLVEKIYEEKRRLIAEGKIKKDKQESYIYKGDDNCYYEKIGNNAPVKLEDLPFDIPDSWAFYRLETFTFPVGSKFNQILSKEISETGPIPVVSQGKNLIDGYCNQIDKVIEVDHNCPLVLFGDHTRNVKIIDFSFVIGADGTKIFSPILINSEFLYYSILYLSSKLKNRGYARHYCLLKSQLLPLPPLNEQMRIVRKINACGPLIANYSIVEEKLSKLEEEFPEKLKKSILQYAIEGKLVKQDPNDEPASVLLERIKAEKEKLIKEGKIKRDKNESYIYQGDDKNYYENNKLINDILPFYIPQNWIWCRLQNIGTLTRGNGIKRNEIVNKGQGCIRYGEIYTSYDTVCLTPKSHINNDIFYKSLKISKNDILMTLTGENKADIAKAVAYLGENMIACGGDLTVLSNHKCNPLYLVYLLNSPYGIHCKHDLSSGDIIVHISNEKLSSILTPIPPIQEQNRIVEKISLLNNIIQ